MACIRKSRFTTFGGLCEAAATNAEGVLIIRLHYKRYQWSDLPALFIILVIFSPKFSEITFYRIECCNIASAALWTGPFINFLGSSYELAARIFSSTLTSRITSTKLFLAPRLLKQHVSPLWRESLRWPYHERRLKPMLWG